MGDLIATFRNRGLVTLMLGHFSVDSYVGLLPVLFPLLIGRFHLELAAVSGLGSGCFHPLGALTVRALLPARGAATAMSVYVTGGTLGLAAGPIIGIVVFGLFGTRGTAVMLVPGLSIAGFLVAAMRVR